MLINRLLADSKLPQPERHVVELAFGYTLEKLGLVDRDDLICNIVAHKVIQVRMRHTGCSAVAIAHIAARELGL